MSVETRPFPVVIDGSVLPPEEAAAVFQIGANLAQLHHSLNEFNHSLDLCTSAKLQLEAASSRGEAMAMSSWAAAAVRNAVLVTFGLEKLMAAINGTPAPELHARRDREERKAASRTFANEFPNLSLIRDAAAHPFEFASNPSELARHSVPEGAKLLGLETTSGFVTTFAAYHLLLLDDGASVSATVRGRIATFELTSGKRARLREVYDHFERSFFPLEPPFAQRLRVDFAENGRVTYFDEPTSK